MSSFPKIHFGVYLVKPEDTTKAVVDALEVGYTGIDSARAYHNEREAVLGILEYLKKHPEKKREDIFYTTKVNHLDFGPGAEAAKSAVKESFERAKELGHIDLILLHSSHGGPAVRKAAWEVLEESQAEGLVKHIGVSNWGVKHLEELAKTQKVTPYVNQIELNPWLQHRDIKEYDDAHGIITEAYSPLTRGKRLDDPELVTLSKKYSKTPAQILLKWALQYGTVPIPKSTTPSRIKENFEVFNFELSKEDFEALGDPKDYWVSSPAWDPTVLP